MSIKNGDRIYCSFWILVMTVFVALLTLNKPTITKQQINLKKQQAAKKIIQVLRQKGFGMKNDENEYSFSCTIDESLQVYIKISRIN